MVKRFIIYARNDKRTTYVTEFRTQEAAKKFMQENARKFKFKGSELYCVVKYF